ncbi:MAG: MFS transporter [Lentisphaeria bacterium]|nr:MFS transporter [Lentisphaeria bacterium]
MSESKIKSAVDYLKNLPKDKGITLALAWSFNQLAYAIVYPFIPIYLSQERGMPYTTVSLIFPLMGLATIIAPLPSGWITDKLGRRFTMLFGQFARGVMFFILAYCVFIKAPFWLFAIILMINTSVGITFQVGADAYLADITTPDERQSYFGKIRIGFNIGWALGPMIGAFFAKTPFWLFFIITGILCLIGTVYTQVACFSKSASNGIRKETVKQEKSEVEVNIFDAVFKNPKFLLLVSGTFFLTLLVSQLYSTLSIYSTKCLQISRESLGSIYSLNGTLVLALQIPVVMLFKKIKCPVTIQLMIGVIIYIMGYLSIIPCSTALAVALAVSIITIGEITVQPALYSSISNCTNQNNAGRLLSIYSLMRGISVSVGPWFGAQLLEKYNSPLILWGGLSSFAAIAAILFAFTGNKSEKNC